jgi:hypothetical protein
MKTGQLFGFGVKELSGALDKAFAADAIKDFDKKDEVQCGGCSHQTGSLYVVAETRLHALRRINSRKMGLCANCIAELIAKEGWNIVTKADRF